MIISCCMNKKYIFALCISYCIIYPAFFRRKIFTKTHTYNLCAIINCIPDRVSNIFIMLIAIRHCTYHHYFYIVCNTIHSYSIVSCCSNYPGAMCAM